MGHGLDWYSMYVVYHLCFCVLRFLHSHSCPQALWRYVLQLCSTWVSKVDLFHSKRWYMGMLGVGAIISLALKRVGTSVHSWESVVSKYEASLVLTVPTFRSFMMEEQRILQPVHLQVVMNIFMLAVGVEVTNMVLELGIKTLASKQIFSTRDLVGFLGMLLNFSGYRKQSFF